MVKEVVASYHVPGIKPSKQSKKLLKQIKVKKTMSTYNNIRNTTTSESFEITHSLQFPERSECSIYIPLIPKNIHPNKIAKVFEQHVIGKVKRVDFVPIGKSAGFGKRDDEYTDVCSAFVHFWYFCTNLHTNQILEQLNEPEGSYRLHFNYTEAYWILVKNRNPIPDSVMNTHQIVENARILETRVIEQDRVIRYLEKRTENSEYRHEEEIRKLNEQIEKLNQTVELLTTRLNQTVENLIQYEKDRTHHLESTISPLQTWRVNTDQKIAEMTMQTGALDSRTVDLEKKANALEKGAENINTKMSALQIYAEGVEEKVELLTTRNSFLKSEMRLRLGGLDNKTDILEENVGLLRTITNRTYNFIANGDLEEAEENKSKEDDSILNERIEE